MLLDSKDHELLQDFVTHEELLGSSRDVSVVVKDSHACESGNMHLHRDVSGQISVDLGLFGWMDSRIKSSSGVVKALVSDFIDHLLSIYYYYNHIHKINYLL